MLTGPFFFRYCSHIIAWAVVLLLFNWACRRPGKPTGEEVSLPFRRARAHADTMVAKGQNRQALAYLDSVYQAIARPAVKEQYEWYNIQFNHYFWFEPDPALAGQFADSLLLLLQGKEERYKIEYANTLFAKGDALLMIGKHLEGFEYYYKCLDFARQNLEPCEAYSFTYRMAMLKYRQENYRDAIVYIKQAFGESEGCTGDASLSGIHLSRQSYLNGIALCFEKLQQPDSAIHYYQKALLFLDTVDRRFPQKKGFIQGAKGVIYGNMGGVYAQTHQFREAEVFLKKSITINDRPGFEVLDAQTAKLKLAKMYIQQSNLSGAKRLLKQIQQALESPELEKAGIGNIRLRFYEIQWRYFDKAGDLPNAYASLRKYYDFKDSLEARNAGLKGMDVEMYFREKEQAYKLALLGKDNEIKKDYLLASFVFSFLIIGVLVIVWVNGRRLKDLNSKIIRKNSDVNKTLRDLEQSQKENTRIMNIVAHDLRAPIAATISITEILKASNLSDSDLELVDLLDSTSRNTMDMIADLLEFNVSPENIEKDEVEMRALLEYCVNLFRFRALKKKQTLRLGGHEATVWVNREQIWRVISNLIVNAIKFSPEGGQIDVSLSTGVKTLLITIKDTGIGIPNEIGEKIFDTFTDAKRTGTAGEHSYGLGLSISRQIVRAHGGQIWFESKVGQGSVFFVELPLN